MKATRPVYINLWRIQFPVTAVVSVLHRISGIVIFFSLPFFLYLLQQSLVSQDSFDQLTVFLSHAGVKLITWIALSAVAWHFIAGVRHLLMDMGYGEELKPGRASAYAVFIITAIIVILLGIALWL